MLSGEGKAHRVGDAAFNLYVPSSVSSDSSFPIRETGTETRVELLPCGALLISAKDGSVELSDNQRQQINQIINNNE